jgi:hypothetical protein
MGNRAHLLNNSTGLFNYRSSSELVLKPVLEPRRRGPPAGSTPAPHRWWTGHGHSLDDAVSKLRVPIDALGRMLTLNEAKQVLKRLQERGR